MKTFYYPKICLPTAVTIPKLGDEINISEDGVTYNELVNFENKMVGKPDMKLICFTIKQVNETVEKACNEMKRYSEVLDGIMDEDESKEKKKSEDKEDDGNGDKKSI